MSTEVPTVHDMQSGSRPPAVWQALQVSILLACIQASKCSPDGQSYAHL